MFSRRNFRHGPTTLMLLALLTLSASDGQTFRYLREGMSAPDFSLRTFQGEQIHLQEALGSTPVVLLFWSSWSSRGFAELADFHLLYEQFLPARFQVLAINVDAQSLSAAQRDSIRLTILENGSWVTFLWDDGLAVFREYGVIAVPSTLVLDSTGRIRAALNGYPRSGRALIEDSLSRLLGLAAPTAILPTRFEGHKPVEKSRLRLNLGLQLCREKQYARAVRELQNACELDTEFVQPLLTLGETLERLEKREQAEEAYRRALVLDPQSALALGRLGALALARGDTVASSDYLQRALNADVNYYPARITRAELLIQSGDLAAAKTDLDVAAESNPGDPQLTAAQARLAQKSGDLPTAIRLLRAQVEELLK